MYPDALDIIIVGGSLSGLWTAVALKSLPNVARITILERLDQTQLRDLGAGIRCNNQAIDAIREVLGLPPEKYATLLNMYRMIDRTGHVYYEAATEGWTSTWAQLYRIFREAFDADPKCEYRLGCTLVNVYEDDNASKLWVEFVDEHHVRTRTSAQLVVGADGASSAIRSLMLPEIQRSLQGYVCYRGVIAQSALSPEAAKLYDKAGTFSYPDAGQFTSYLVPGNDAPADEASIFVNWVLYQNKTPQEMTSLMTDKAGRLHRFSLPYGGMRPEEIEKVKATARRELPPLHAEVVNKTDEPFVQGVTDSLSTEHVFYGGKLLLVGDAVGGQRPHTASAVLQGTHHGLMLRKLLQDEISLEVWAKETYRFSRALVTAGQELGQVLMSPVLEKDRERTMPYMKVFMAAQHQLGQIWTETISGQESAVKM